MRRVALLLALGLPFAASAAAAVVACSSDGDAAATPPPEDAAVDAPPPPDAGPDAAPDACVPVDVPPGTGKRFCDLPGTDVPEVQVPADFCVREFTTTPVGEARVLRFSPSGDLFVSAPSMTTVGGARGGTGGIFVLPDDDGDGRADAILRYAGSDTDAGTPEAGAICADFEGDPADLTCVHGLAFAPATGDYLYYTRSDEVRRFHYTKGDRAAPGAAGEVVATLGGASIPDVRWTHTLELVPDGSLYVSRGRFDSNECTPEQIARGAVFALHVERGGALPLSPELVADGFRNPMYMRCSPSSCGDCYAAELSGDSWDGIGGREKLALLRQGDHWGFPCCVARDMPAPDAGAFDCSGVGRELVSVALHDTPFGLDFERGAFPAPYTHGVFVALHGAFTSFGGTGVVYVATDPVTLRPSDAPKPFATGFTPQGRATEVAFAPDGRLFVADDTSGKIYWIAPRTLAAPR